MLVSIIPRVYEIQTAQFTPKLPLDSYLFQPKDTLQCNALPKSPAIPYILRQKIHWSVVIPPLESRAHTVSHGLSLTYDTLAAQKCQHQPNKVHPLDPRVPTQKFEPMWVLWLCRRRVPSTQYTWWYDDSGNTQISSIDIDERCGSLA